VTDDMPLGAGELSVGKSRWTLKNVELHLAYSGGHLMPQLRAETDTEHANTGATFVEFYGIINPAPVTDPSRLAELNGVDIELDGLEADAADFSIDADDGTVWHGWIGSEGPQRMRMDRVGPDEAVVNIDDEFAFERFPENIPARAQVRLTCRAVVIWADPDD
jgi:hypothetical protein